MPGKSTDRRDFLKTSSLIGAGAAAPYFFSSAKTLADETTSKNDRPTIGVIGCGGMGLGNMKVAKEYCDVVALADVDSGRMGSFADEFNVKSSDCYADYRKILERDDVDLLHIATPDHWHTKPLIEAMRAGKDVYCEKPLTLTIDEGKQICQVQKETGRIIQVGTQQRSSFDLFVKAIAIVAEGRVGKIQRMKAAIGGSPKSGPIPVAPTPEALDWNAYLGPAPLVDYRSKTPTRRDGKPGHTKSNCHYEFRWWYEYSGGKLTDWGAHHVDIGVWALEVNGQSTTPIAVGGTAEHLVDFVDGVPQQNDRYNTATKFNLVAEFEDGVEMEIVDGPDNGLLIEGDKGRIFVNRGRITGKPVEDLKENPLPEGAIQRVYKNLPTEGNGRIAHWANFVRCVRQGKTPISDVHSHMRMLNVCHLAGISARLGRRVEWDNAAGQITGDELANSMLARPYRAGFEIEA